MTARSGAPADPSSNVSNVTVSLAPGWNPLGFQSPVLTGLSDNPSVPGAATTEAGSQSYKTIPYSLDSFNSVGGRRGFFLFATGPANLTYSGRDDGQGDFVSLDAAGYNLVSFCTSTPIDTARLTATQNGQTVPLSSVILPTIFEVGRASNTPVPVPGGTILPGRAYWIFSTVAGVRLNVNPPVVRASALELTPGPSATVATFGTVQFSLRARLADGTTQDVTNQATWASADPSVAALLAPGQFKGLNPFATTVTAAYGGLTSTANLTVVTTSVPPPLASPSPAASFIAVGNLSAAPGAPVNSFTLTTTNAAQVGDLLVVSTGWATTASRTMRVTGDSAGNAYTGITSSSAATHGVAAYRSILTNPLPAGSTISLDLNGSATLANDAYVASVSGFRGWTALDRNDPDTLFAVGPTTSLTTGTTLALSTQPELVFTMFSAYAGTAAAAPTFTPMAGDTAATSASAVSGARAVHVFTSFRRVTVTTGQTTTGTLGTPFTFDPLIFTFR